MLFQGLGLHIIPNHFAQPIPDTTKLKDALWSRHSELAGIQINEKNNWSCCPCLYLNSRTNMSSSQEGKHQYHMSTILVMVGSKVLMLKFYIA